MIVSIKNIKNGGKGWSDYVLGKNQKRDKAKLIAGDTILGDAIVKNLNYKSGNATTFVISFSNEDNIKEEKGREIVKDWFKVFMKGFDTNEFHLDIVEHQDTDFIHYHARIPKINLLTNTQLKPYYHKSDLNFKKAVNEYIADKYDLTLGSEVKKLTPKIQDKEKQIAKWREEHQQKPFDLSSKKSRGLAEENLKSFINSLILQGLVLSLDDVKKEILAMDFEILNEGFDRGKSFHYLTIGKGKNKLRVKGDIYGREFFEHNKEDREKAISDNKSLGNGDKNDRRSRTDIIGTLQKEFQKRLKFIDKQYAGARKRAISRAERESSNFSKNNTLSSPPLFSDWRTDRSTINPLFFKRATSTKDNRNEDSQGRTGKRVLSNQGIESDTKSKGVEDDRIRAEAFRRIRKLREEQRERAIRIQKAIATDFQRDKQRISKKLEYYTREREQQQQELNHALEDANRTEQSDYYTIEESIRNKQAREQRRRDNRTVVTNFRKIFYYFGDQLNRFKQSIDRANSKLHKAIVQFINTSNQKEKKIVVKHAKKRRNSRPKL